MSRQDLIKATWGRVRGSADFSRCDYWRAPILNRGAPFVVAPPAAKPGRDILDFKIEYLNDHAGRRAFYRIVCEGVEVERAPVNRL